MVAKRPWHPHRLSTDGTRGSAGVMRIDEGPNQGCSVKLSPLGYYMSPDLMLAGHPAATRFSATARFQGRTLLDAVVGRGR